MPALAAVLLLAGVPARLRGLRVRARVLAAHGRLGQRVRHRPARAVDGLQGPRPARRPRGHGHPRGGARSSSSARACACSGSPITRRGGRPLPVRLRRLRRREPALGLAGLPRPRDRARAARASGCGSTGAWRRPPRRPRAAGAARRASWPCASTCPARSTSTRTRSTAWSAATSWAGAGRGAGLRRAAPRLRRGHGRAQHPVSTVGLFARRHRRWPARSWRLAFYLVFRARAGRRRESTRSRGRRLGSPRAGAARRRARSARRCARPRRRPDRRARARTRTTSSATTRGEARSAVSRSDASASDRPSPGVR